MSLPYASRFPFEDTVFMSLMRSTNETFRVSYFSGPLTTPTVLFPLEDITWSPVCRIENDKSMKLVVLDILAPSPLILTCMGSPRGWPGWDLRNSLMCSLSVAENESCAPGKWPGILSIWQGLFTSFRFCFIKYDRGKPSDTMVNSWYSSSLAQNLSSRNSRVSRLSWSSVLSRLSGVSLTLPNWKVWVFPVFSSCTFRKESSNPWDFRDQRATSALSWRSCILLRCCLSPSCSIFFPRHRKPVFFLTPECSQKVPCSSLPTCPSSHPFPLLSFPGLPAFLWPDLAFLWLDLDTSFSILLLLLLHGGGCLLSPGQLQALFQGCSGWSSCCQVLFSSFHQPFSQYTWNHWACFTSKSPLDAETGLSADFEPLPRYPLVKEVDIINRVSLLVREWPRQTIPQSQDRVRNVNSKSYSKVVTNMPLINYERGGTVIRSLKSNFCLWESSNKSDIFKSAYSIPVLNSAGNLHWAFCLMGSSLTKEIARPPSCDVSHGVIRALSSLPTCQGAGRRLKRQGFHRCLAPLPDLLACLLHWIQIALQSRKILRGRHRWIDATQLLYEPPNRRYFVIFWIYYKQCMAEFLLHFSSFGRAFGTSLFANNSRIISR